MKIVDLIDRQFGKLRVIKLTNKRTKDKRKIWLCQCDCGNFREVTSKSLHDGDTVSCGCRGKLPKGESALNGRYYRYQQMAQERNLSFELSKSQFRILGESNCFYCGKYPEQQAKRPRCNGFWFYNGIDRIDNTKGYSIDNCVSCCGVCNRMKSDMSRNEFLQHCKKVVAMTVVSSVI